MHVSFLPARPSQSQHASLAFLATIPAASTQARLQRLAQRAWLLRPRHLLRQPFTLNRARVAAIPRLTRSSVAIPALGPHQTSVMIASSPSPKVAPERSQCARRAAWTANRARVAAIPRLSRRRARTARQRLDHDGRLRSTDLAMALAVVKAIPAAIGQQVHRVQPFAHSNTTAPAIPRFNTTTHSLTLMGRKNQDAHCAASWSTASLVV